MENGKTSTTNPSSNWRILSNDVMLKLESSGLEDAIFVANNNENITIVKIFLNIKIPLQNFRNITTILKKLVILVLAPE